MFRKLKSNYQKSLEIVEKYETGGGGGRPQGLLDYENVDVME